MINRHTDNVVLSWTMYACRSLLIWNCRITSYTVNIVLSWHMYDCRINSHTVNAVKPWAIYNCRITNNLFEDIITKSHVDVINNESKQFHKFCSINILTAPHLFNETWSIYQFFALILPKHFYYQTHNTLFISIWGLVVYKIEISHHLLSLNVSIPSCSKYPTIL